MDLILQTWENIGDTLLKRLQTNSSPGLAAVDIFRIALPLPADAKEKTSCL
jgi:hypothetical protein